MGSIRRRRAAGACVAIVAVAVIGLVLAGRELAPVPVAIVDADLVDGNWVVVVIDRCESEPAVGRVELDEVRIVVEVVAGAGSGNDCQDGVEVAFVTDDIVELEDATSGAVFRLRVVRPERANRPTGVSH